MVYVLDSDIIVSEFNLLSRYNIHFWTNTKAWNFSSLPVYELNSTQLFFDKNDFGIK